jgi:hypothetical protein
MPMVAVQISAMPSWLSELVRVSAARAAGWRGRCRAWLVVAVRPVDQDVFKTLP